MEHTITDRRAVSWLSLPTSERILDRMGDLLLCADDILTEAETGLNGATAGTEVKQVIGRVFDDVNRLMRKMTD